MSEPQYLLTKGSKGYYRSGARGYTYDRAEAGLFSLEEAEFHCFGCHGEVAKEEVPQPEEGSYILASNLEQALRDALTFLEERGYRKDAYHVGLESNLAYLRVNHTLEVRQS